jgi:signal transduction histidine kinase
LLDPISKTAVQLVDNMRDLIWVLHPANNSLDVLTSRIREYANEYLKDFGWLPTFSIPDTIPEIEIPKEVHRNILMVVKEAIQNIAKHSEAKHVHLVFDFRSGFQLSIEDDGKGHPSDPTPGKGNGLLNMRNRMHQIGGNLDIKTGQGQGTTVVLFMPLSFRPHKNPT